MGPQMGWNGGTWSRENVTPTMLVIILFPLACFGGPPGFPPPMSMPNALVPPRDLPGAQAG